MNEHVESYGCHTYFICYSTHCEYYLPTEIDHDLTHVSAQLGKESNDLYESPLDIKTKFFASLKKLP